MFNRNLIHSFVALGALCGSLHAQAQTIDDIADLHRQKTIAALKKEIAATNQNPLGAPAGTGIVVPNLAPGADPAVHALPMPVKKAEAIPEPTLMLVSIFGVGKSLVAEIAEDGQHTTYSAGDKTASGWLVDSIARRTVRLTKKVGKKEKVRILRFAPTVTITPDAALPGAGIPALPTLRN